MPWGKAQYTRAGARAVAFPAFFCYPAHMIDLHTHSTASDGSFPPQELAALAAKGVLSLWALTDHDCIDGLAAAEEASAALSLAFIPGVELAVERAKGELHLLGYGIRAGDPALEALLEKASAERASRNARICRLFAEQGIQVDMARVRQLAGGGSVGRPHFARWLVECGMVKNVQQAFSRWLAAGRPCYAAREGLDLREAVSAVRHAGGVPVLAHPLSLYVSWGKMPAVLEEIRDAGVPALEAWHPGARPADCRRLERLADALGMRVTAGSDFHGEARPERKLGITAGGRPIDGRFYTEGLAPLLGKAAR